MLRSLAPARRRFYLTIGALALVGVVAATASLALRTGPSVRPVGQDAQPPVVLVPGYGGSTAGLDVLARDLRTSGRTVVIAELGGSNVGDLRRQADVLDEVVQRLRRETGRRSVDLVGYSAGGVVVRLWVHQHAGGSIARRIVSLGSPQHGTEVAALASDVAPAACPTACRQLAPDSSVLRSLNAGDETPPGPRWISIWTEQDQTVVPADSDSLVGALDFSVQSVCPGVDVTHGGLPSNSKVIAMVMSVLTRSLPGVPDRSICA